MSDQFDWSICTWAAMATPAAAAGTGCGPGWATSRRSIGCCGATRATPTRPISRVSASRDRGTPALIATKFQPRIRATADDLPGALRASLARLRRTSVDLYQHHFPTRATWAGLWSWRPPISRSRA